MGNNKNSLLDVINLQIFTAPAIALIAFIAWGVFFPANFTLISNTLLTGACKYFTWFMGPVVFFMFFFCLWSAFSKYGNIRLGGADAKPRMSRPKWFAIALTSGTGAGLCFYGAYSPVYALNNLPPFEHADSVAQAVMLAFQWTYLQWTFHPYAIFTTCGIVMSFLYYNAKRKYRVSEMFYGVVGDKVDGTFGNVIDSISVYLMVIGIAVSMGFSTLQTARGLDVIFGIPSDVRSWIVVLGAFTLIYSAAAVSGIEKAITFISSVNMYLYYWIAIWAFVFVDPLNIMSLLFTSIGSYLSNFVRLSFELDPVMRTGWIQGNPIFFYCWWALFAPMVGMFLVKLAYGRTIREFVLVNLIAPVLFSFVWFTWLGGSAIFIDLFENGSIYKSIAAVGPDVALYTLCDYLPWPAIMKIVSFLVVILSFITMGEAISVSMASITAKDYEDTDGLTKPPSVLVIFWAIIMMGATYILLATGGMAALQASAVVWGFPILVAMCFMMYGHIKCMMNLKDYDKSGDYDYLNYDPAQWRREANSK